MERVRQIKRIVKGKSTVDGAGVRLVRVFGHHDTEDFDPFLLLDAFDSTEPSDYIKGFPWHPHRGIETITYLISGDIEHGDSLKNSGSILDGDCQWMTAGSGIIHQEMPKESPRMLGAQIWLNLPAKDKMTVPAYGDIKSEDVPVIEEDGKTIKIISGEYSGQKGAFEGKYIKALYLDVQIPPGKEWSCRTNPENTLFIYIFRGKGVFNSGTTNEETVINDKQAVLFGQGDIFRIKASDEGIRFILLSGKPLREPVAWGGPIVMNTREELDTAFEELDAKTFIK